MRNPSHMENHTKCAYVALQGTLVMLNILCKVDDHENDVRWIYLTAVRNIRESRKCARNGEHMGCDLAGMVLF